MSYMYMFDSGSNYMYVLVLMCAGLLKKKERERERECLAMLDALIDVEFRGGEVHCYTYGLGQATCNML